MKEQLISFETAKLAKEMEFFEICNDSYISIGILENNLRLSNKWKRDYVFYTAPTQALLQKWLREKHNILLIVLPWKDHAADTNDPYTFRPMIVNVKTWSEYKTYEEALEKGLQEALKLIKSK